MTHGNEHLQGKMNGLKGKLPASHTTASTRVFCYFSVSFIFLCFVWVLVFLLNFILFWRILQKHKVDVRGKGDEWDWNARCEVHKRSTNVKIKQTKIAVLIYSYLSHIFLMIMQIAYRQLRGARGRTPSLLI